MPTKLFDDVSINKLFVFGWQSDKSKLVTNWFDQLLMLPKKTMKLPKINEGPICFIVSSYT